MSLMGLQGALGQMIQSGASDNKQLEKDRKWSKLKGFIGDTFQGANTGAEAMLSKKEGSSPDTPKQMPSAEDVEDVPKAAAKEIPRFEPEDVKAAEFGNVNVIKPAEFDYETKLSILKKIMGE